MKKDIIIFDTTLRDGSQTPGSKMTQQGKIAIAKQLEILGVNVIEAGFPASSETNFHTVEKIAKTIKNSTVCALARATKEDIEITGKALKHAPQKRIHTFIATSKIHLQHKLKISPEEAIEKAVFAIKEAKKWTDDIQFSAEDAFRSEDDFLFKIIEQAIKAGATTINLPDTVGYATPIEYGNFFKRIINNVTNSDKAIFSAHCHNDLGMAVANSIFAIQNGAQQIEGCINGIGERAGNAALEEIIMAIKTRQDHYLFNTNIQHNQLLKTSRLVEQKSKIKIQKNKAIIGDNAFSHESGIHQDGMLKNNSTYEIMNPKDIGWENTTIILGKNSGRTALKHAIKKLNIKTNKDFESIFIKFKVLAEKKHQINENDLLSLIQ